MPEMPEVETVRRTLTPLVKGKTIAKIIIWYPKIIVNNPDEFVEKLTNKKIRNLYIPTVKFIGNGFLHSNRDIINNLYLPNLLSFEGNDLSYRR